MIEKTRFESNQGNVVTRIESELELHIENLEPLSFEDLGDNSEVYTAVDWPVPATGGEINARYRPDILIPLISEDAE